jgi:hypothetical protein
VIIKITGDMMLELYSKKDLIKRLEEIRKMGWIPNNRPGNVGGIGNTLEDLLGIKENNLPIPNAAEWELKCHRLNSSALVTLFHMEPSPRAVDFVSKVLLPLYGWKHPSLENIMSFRQTINASSRTDRGFKIVIDRQSRKIVLSFDAKAVDKKHSDWLKAVGQKVGLSEINPQPYWGFDDLFHQAGTKLLNCFYIRADVKREGQKEYYWYKEIMILQTFDLDKFLDGLEKGFIFIDFDARTNHNHGTKFRIRSKNFQNLYKEITII